MHPRLSEMNAKNQNPDSSEGINKKAGYDAVDDMRVDQLDGDDNDSDDNDYSDDDEDSSFLVIGGKNVTIYTAGNESDNEKDSQQPLTSSIDCRSSVEFAGEDAVIKCFQEAVRSHDLPLNQKYDKDESDDEMAQWKPKVLALPKWLDDPCLQNANNYSTV